MLIINIFKTILYLPLLILFLLLASLICRIKYPHKKWLEIEKSETKLNGVSFIIPTWNKREMILKCLNNLESILIIERKVPIEIIVVDNGSEDGTYEALNKLKLLIPLQIIKNKTNEGFAKAINKAVHQATFNYVYLMNNDMFPKQNFFSEIIQSAKQKIENNEHFFALTSQIIFHDSKKRREESGKTYSTFNLGKLQVMHYILDENLKYDSITLYAGGGSSFINKNLFIKLGEYDFDTYKPLYVEDFDLCFNAWRFGFPSYYLHTSVVVHHHQSSTIRLSKSPSYYIEKNLVMFILKNIQNTKLLFQYFIFSPFNMTLSDSFVIDVLKNISQLLKARISIYKYKVKYKDNDLINFIPFELKYAET